VQVSIKNVLLIFLLAASVTFADDEGPRTGYFKIEKTPVEILGENAVHGVTDVLPADEEISWQLYVPHNYSRENPPGVVVYVSPWERGGPPKAWNASLTDRNLIWIGANAAGNKSKVAERMIKAMIAPMLLSHDYVINLDRCYVAGFSGGGITATRIATARPEQFKGGLYMAGTVFWEDNLPPKIEQIRRNRHVFMVGTYDPALENTQRVYKKYKEAGVENADLIMIRNYRHRMPRSAYFERAIDYLDARD